jgi:hypothetical protein
LGIAFFLAGLRYRDENYNEAAARFFQKA